MAIRWTTGRVRFGFALALALFAMAATAASASADNLIVTVSTTIPAQQTGSGYSGVVASFVQGGIDPTETATINWGDGTPDDTTATVSSQSCQPYTNNDDSDCGPIMGQAYALQGTVSGSHTFARPGPYTITVTITGTYSTVHFSRATHTVSATGTIPAVSASCNHLASLGYAKMQIVNSGCITTSGTQQVSSAGSPVRVDGLELDPQSGVSLTLDSATGTLSSNGGKVGMKLGCGSCGQSQTSFAPQAINWRVVPNPGEQQIDVGSTGRFQVSIGGLTLSLPVLSLNSIDLLPNQSSNTNFTVALPLPSIAKFFGTIKATATMLSDNATGAHFDGLDAEIAASQKPEIKGTTVAAPFKAFSGHLKFTLSTDTWLVSLTFDVPGAGGVSAAVQIDHGTPSEVAFSASYTTPGLAIGDTGAFLQGINGKFVDYPEVKHPEIGVTQHSSDPATESARQSTCANYNTYYDQYIALGQAFPSYCGQVGMVDFDPPMEIDGGVTVSAGPVIGKASAMVITGSFRYVDSYNDGTNNVPWAFDVQGGVTMVGLPFNKTPQQVYGASPGVKQSKYTPINNSGAQAWAQIHGDGLVEAGGGFDYAFPQNTDDWFIKLDGDVGVSLVPKGAAIGAPAPGATPEQYANVVQSHANNWSIVGTIEGDICAQIPSVASACVTGAGGISNNGVAGCASFTLPGSQVLQAIAVAGAKAINAIAEFGQTATTAVAQEAQTLAQQASNAATTTANYVSSAASTAASGAQSVANTVGSGLSSAASTVAGWFGPRRPARPGGGGPTAHAADVVSTNITIPNVTYSIGALYRWSNHQTQALTTCSHDALVSALSAADVARVSSARGVPSIQVRVGKSGPSPRLFVIKGVTAAPDVIVMGPDRRAIRTKGPGFVEPGWIVYKYPKQKLTYVDAVAAPAGKWDFVAVPGSSRIAGVQTAAGFPIAIARAGVQAAKHHRFIVKYRVTNRGPGETVTLQETAGGLTATIARLRGRHGSVVWRPSRALTGDKRTLVAVVKKGSRVLAVQPLIKANLAKVAVHRVKRHRHHKRHKKHHKPEREDLGRVLGYGLTI
jgi:hypothetical protein